MNSVLVPSAPAVVPGTILTDGGAVPQPALAGRPPIAGCFGYELEHDQGHVAWLWEGILAARNITF